MKIGLLAYHSAINFGATLQLLSTYMYLRNKGHDPIVINWVPKDLEALYGRLADKIQSEMYEDMRLRLWKETARCFTAQDVADVIRDENIQAVIAGSDAVAQHHPFLERIVFPSRKIISLNKVTSDRLFPNPFWGTFNNYLQQKVPFALLSGSSQDSAYQYICKKTKKKMADAVMGYSYISVRDDWTQKMISCITDGAVVPDVTPDPVFAFRYNANALIPSRQEILRRFNLPEKYFLFSFLNDTTVRQQWLTEFEREAKEQGIGCVSLPFSHKRSFGKLEYSIDLPLSPIDWFAIIRYSNAYIGNNMHPIIVSIHNGVPFFSFDNYGRPLLGGRKRDEDSSKILHLLRRAGLEDNRISSIASGYSAPAPQVVLQKIKSFDRTKEQAFADSYYDSYRRMMENIEKAIQ